MDDQNRNKQFKSIMRKMLLVECINQICTNTLQQSHPADSAKQPARQLAPGINQNYKRLPKYKATQIPTVYTPTLLPR